MEAGVRKLVAIMFTDIAGYTAMMGEDEERGVRALGRSREVVRGEVAARGGRLLDEVGDGSLSSFESAVEAVVCALAIQKALQGDPDVRLRIGIHVGDVLVSPGGVVGDGVNVASRIHGLAAPGQICASDRVYEHVRNQPGLRARPLGEQRLKGVDRRVKAWLLEAADAPAHGSDRPRRRGLRAAGIAAAALALVATALWATGAWERLALRLLVRLPPLLGSGVPQSLGFATASDGVRIAYATSGAGPPIVQAIGWLTHLERGVDSPACNGWVGHFSQRHRFVRYDGRGTGLSDRAGAKAFSLETRLRDLDAVVDALALERFALFGVSAGGPTALAYAARHPERLSHLVLIGGFANASSVLVGRPVWDAIEGMMRAGWGAENPAARRMFTSLLLPEAPPLQQSFVAELMQQSMTGEDAARFLQAGREIELGPLLPGIRVPTLVVHARGDLAVPLEAARETAAGIPGAQFRVFETSNHAFPQSDPATAQMIEAVERFLDEGGAGGEAPAAG